MSYSYQQANDITLNDESLDLTTYFERIGYSGTPQPTLSTLHDLIFKHTTTIPFENLNPLLGWPVKLDIPSLQQKIVIDQRGGYCFEQNMLFSHVLKTIGFDVSWLSARVLWNRPAGVINPRTHMLLLVKINQEPFIADVGFGGLTFTTALKFDTTIEQETPHENFRFVQEQDEYILQARVKNEWRALYVFDLQKQLLPDFEATSWYLCNYPQSHFIKTLRVARPAPGYRYTLNNTEFTIHHLSGDSEHKVLSSAEEVLQTLEDVFYIKLPGTPALKKVIERIMSETSA